MAVSSERAASPKSRGRSASGQTSGSTKSSPRKSASAGAKRSSSASAKRSPSASAKRSSSARSASQASSGQKRAASRSGASRKGAAASQKASRTAQNGKQATRSASNGSTGLARVVVPVATATIGVAGGVLLGRNGKQQQHRKVLGLELPTKIDFAGVSQQLGQAGRQLGKLVTEVQNVRSKAEQVGRALS